MTQTTPAWAQAHIVDGTTKKTTMPFDLEIDGILTAAGSAANLTGSITATAPAGSGSGVAGHGHTFVTGAGGGGNSFGGDITVNLGAGTGGSTASRGGQLIINSTDTGDNGSSYNGMLTLNQTFTPGAGQVNARQATNWQYNVIGDAANFPGTMASLTPIESQFHCQITGGTVTPLLYGAEFQFIHEGTATVPATVIQADMYGLAASPGTLSNAVNYRAVLGPLNGVTATVATCFQAESGGFATRLGIAAVNTKAVRNFLANVLIGSPSGIDTAGGYGIYGFQSGVPSQGGNTTGTNDNRGVYVSVTTPNSTGGVPGVNGTVNNTAGWFAVPTAGGPGSGTGRTINCAILINGNGNAGTQGLGFANDWALFSNSTAPTGFAGRVGIGNFSTPTPPATNSMLHVNASATIVSGAGSIWKGVNVATSTITMSGTSNVTTATGFNLIEVAAPVISWATANSVLNAASLAIIGPPTGAGAGPAIITNAYPFWVQAGLSRFDGSFLNNHVTTAAINSSATATAAQAATGWITSTSAAPTTITLPTGTNLGAALAAGQGTSFDLFIDNTAGASTVTIAVNTNAILSAEAAAVGASAGLLTVPSGATGLACFRLMFSSATAYAFTRIA